MLVLIGVVLSWSASPVTSWIPSPAQVERRACAEETAWCGRRLCAVVSVNMLAKKPQRSQKTRSSSARPAAIGFGKPQSSAPRAKQAEAESAPFIPLPQMTTVVFFSPTCKAVETDGEKAVVALQHVTPGEVLLVEHVVSGVPDHVLNCVLNDAKLFDVLQPRDTPWSVTRLLSDELDALADEKMNTNGFVAEDGTVAVGAAVSAFNHAAPPRAIVRSFSLTVEGMEAPARILCVLACADISPGDEIRIEYRDRPSALHPYVEPSEPSAAASVSGTGEALEAGMETARNLMMSYSTTDDFAGLCVAHDRLLRTIANDA